MRILQLLTDLSPAGAEKIVLELSKELKHRGHDVAVAEIMPLPANTTVLDALRKEGISVESLGVSKTAPQRILGLRRIVRAFHPDVLHSHLIHANLAARLLHPRGVRLVNTVHIAERRPSKKWHFLLDRLTFGLCDIQTCVSNAVREFHAARLKIRPERMAVVYNGVPTPPLPSPERIHALRVEWRVADCARIIGAVGRLDPQKGFDLLLKASEGLPREDRWGIVILGEGTQRSELERLAAALPPNVRCVLPGFRPDAAECVGAFDLFAMPSRYEGFGLSLVEAMFHGVPILASDADSLPELMALYPNGACLTRITAADLVEWAGRPRVAVAPGSIPHTIEKMADAYLRLYV